VCGNLPQSDGHPSSLFNHSYTDGQAPSMAVIQTARLLQPQSNRQANSSVEQTPCNKLRQYLYTTVRNLVASTPTQVLASQCSQLQLLLQLAHTQPSSNRIKCRPPAGSSISQHQQIRPVSITAPASLGAPPSEGVRHGSGPTCEGSNSTHRRQSTLPA
jgi:hypothetical protein